MNSLTALLLIPLLTTSANAKTCEVFVRSIVNGSSFIETKCSDGESNSVEYKSKSDAIKDYFTITQSWSKAWINLGCKNESPESNQTCTFQKPDVNQNQTNMNSNQSSTSLTKCEETQISEIKKSKDHISNAAITGFGAGAVGGALGAAGMVASLAPIFSSTLVLSGDKGENIERDLVLFVVGGAVIFGTIAMVGSTTSAWFNHQTTEKIANRNLVFFRDVRSDGVGPEFDVRAQMILQSLNDKEIYLNRDLTFADKFFSQPFSKEDINKAIARMYQINLPKEVLNLENIKAELKFVGNAFLSKNSLLECNDPKDLYSKITLHTIHQLLNKYIK